jgi:hypothetical protein
MEQCKVIAVTAIGTNINSKKSFHHAQFIFHIIETM